MSYDYKDFEPVEGMLSEVRMDLKIQWVYRPCWLVMKNGKWCIEQKVEKMVNRLKNR
jgi:hypothetical protein